MAIKRAIKAGNKSIVSFKKVIKVGEITQLVAKDNIPATKIQQGVTFTNNGDGSVTANGASTNQYYSEIDIRIGDVYQWQEDDHKYLLLSGMNSNDNGAIECILWVGGLDGQPGQAYNAADLSSRFDFNFTIPKGQYLIKIVKCRIRSGYTAENVTFIPQLFDLTEMFGVGHEPATVAEFKAKFPEAYYPYQRAVLTAYNKVVRPCARKGEVVQLFNKSTYYDTQTRSGITATNNGDGSWTINGTATKSDYINFSPALTSIIGGHKILICGNKENSNFKMGLLNQPIRDDTGTGAIGIFNQSAAKTWGIEWANGAVINNVTIYPQLFDLTAMYGAGNEPKTLADFRKDFPESYYPYSPIQTKNLLKLKLDTVQHMVAPKIVRDTLDVNVKNRGGYAQLDAYLPAGTYTLSAIINNNNDYAEKNNYTILSKEKNAGGIIITGYLQNTLTFTLDKDRSFYILIYPAYGIDSGIYKTAQYKLQIEKGSVATDYVPHDYI